MLIVRLLGFKYDSTMSFWDVFGIAGPVALGVGGALITLMPITPSGNERSQPFRSVLAIAFVVIGIASAISMMEAQSSHDIATARMLTGGDCFPTYGVSGTSPPRGTGPPYKLMIFGGCANVYDVTYSVMHAAPLDLPLQNYLKDYYLRPIAVRHVETVMPYAYPTDISLMPGEYWIRTIARNGQVEEKLIVPEWGFLKQVEYVQKETLSGLILLMCAPIAYCEENLEWAFPKLPLLLDQWWF